MADKIFHGAFSFVPKPNGVEVMREIDPMRDEVLGTWPWTVFEQIVAARAAANLKLKMES